MTASEIRREFLGSNESPLYYQGAKWDALRQHMRTAGCVPEKRDVAGMFQSPQMRKGWLGPDGSWCACDGAHD